jgi:hypothetical protein
LFRFFDFQGKIDLAVKMLHAERSLFDSDSDLSSVRTSGGLSSTEESALLSADATPISEHPSNNRINIDSRKRRGRPSGRFTKRAELYNDSEPALVSIASAPDRKLRTRNPRDAAGPSVNAIITFGKPSTTVNNDNEERDYLRKSPKPSILIKDINKDYGRKPTINGTRNGIKLIRGSLPSHAGKPKIELTSSTPHSVVVGGVRLPVGLTKNPLPVRPPHVQQELAPDLLEDFKILRGRDQGDLMSKYVFPFRRLFSGCISTKSISNSHSHFSPQNAGPPQEP